MLAKIYSAAVYGVDAYEVEIEVNGAGGDPVIVIVGLTRRRGERKPRPRHDRNFRTAAIIGRADGPRSISRRPTLKRKARVSIYRSRSE